MPNNVMLSIRHRGTTNYTAFDGNKINHAKTPNATPDDSDWQSFEADLSAIRVINMLIQIRSLGLEGKNSKEFHIRNLYILRSVLPDERHLHLPDNHPDKVIT